MSESQTTAVAERSRSLTLLSALRWLGIIPASILAGWFGQCFGRFFHFLQNPGYAEYLFPLLRLLPGGFGFALVGAIVAPRYRRATAIFLAALCIVQSLSIHILTQRNPGVVNYMNALGESLGALLGVAATVWYRARKSGNKFSSQRLR